MNTTMEFPDTPGQFLDMFSFTDTKEYYTNGQRCITLHRVGQMLEHYFAERTCHWVDVKNGVLCSNCGIGASEYIKHDGLVRYCSFCGARLVAQ